MDFMNYNVVLMYASYMEKSDKISFDFQKLKKTLYYEAQNYVYKFSCSIVGYKPFIVKK